MGTAVRPIVAATHSCPNSLFRAESRNPNSLEANRCWRLSTSETKLRGKQTYKRCEGPYCQGQYLFVVRQPLLRQAPVARLGHLYMAER